MSAHRTIMHSLVDNKQIWSQSGKAVLNSPVFSKVENYKMYIVRKKQAKLNEVS